MTTAIATEKIYELEGQILEACSCKAPCPCWIGDDPDGGYCDSFVAYHIDQGKIQGVDVSGLTLVKIVYIPGNVLAGGWKAVVYIDSNSTPEQQQLLEKVFNGELGGAIADVANLVSDVLDVRVAPIEYNIENGRGTIKIGDVLVSEMEPYRGPDGSPTKMIDSIFSTIPGSPAYIAKASVHRVDLPEFNLIWDYTGRNAIQGLFRFEHS
ncbi:DUF1326 domain-containing protein [Leptolyngbya sp. FACHB-541]|uniref:DUF1326 domain-containing protein n=1 Tax=Leptolyngbya sp. FACHB-541 TaxID=2692810 RepID=UPI0016830E71|nr:DUF1326 domain-containing protein [Leptolyngbya sp. FACHB-541]MBD2000379.1 DUF1326 domain-containing protein [Leptolyngbya sp. FACHB-541]